MKKISYVLSLLLCAALLTACGETEEEVANIYQVYYVSNSETKVEMHEHDMQAMNVEDQIDELVGCLSEMPEKLEYKAPFAMGFELHDVDVEDGRVALDVDAAYLRLPVTTEVLVRAAIVRTLTQVSGVRYVGITVDGKQLQDSMGNYVGWMNGEQFIDNDGNEINTYELTKVVLYFANEAGNGLIAVNREKYYSTNTPLERFVVDELIAGPSGQGIATINPETKIINVTTKDGICYVNLDENFLTVVNNVSIDVSIYSIVNSLVELSNVNRVQILINGEVPTTFSASSFERNLDMVTTLEK